MRRKVIVRPKASQPPNKAQIEWLYDQIFKTIQAEESTTERKVVVKRLESVYSLQECEETATPLLLTDEP